MKILEGKIISTGMMNTVVVEVLRVTPHPLYRKLVRSTKKYKADTNGMNNLNVGSVVEITETKPMSKDKYFRVTKIVGAGKSVRVEESKKEKELKETELKSDVKVGVRTKTKKAVKKGSK